MARTPFKPYTLRTTVSIPGCGAGRIIRTDARRIEDVSAHRERVRLAIKHALDPATVPPARGISPRLERMGWVRGLESQSRDLHAVAQSLGPRVRWSAAVHFDRDGAIDAPDPMTRVAAEDWADVLRARADALAAEAAANRPRAERSSGRVKHAPAKVADPAPLTEEEERAARVRAETDALRKEARKGYRVDGPADRRADTWTDVPRRPRKASGLF